MAALNLPSAGDVERLERRLRSFSQRLEEVEDQLDRLTREVNQVRRDLKPSAGQEKPEKAEV
jgi:septal ring factor EnvC (AmiA/AmiB activator)